MKLLKLSVWLLQSNRQIVARRSVSLYRPQFSLLKLKCSVAHSSTYEKFHSLNNPKDDLSHSHHVGYDGISKKIYTVDEFLSILKEYLKEDKDSSTYPIISSWIRVSLASFDQFKTHMEKFGQGTLFDEPDAFQRSFLDSQISLLESLHLDFAELVHFLKNSFHSLSSRELQICVLAFGCWPSQFTAGMTIRKRTHVLQRNHSQLREIHLILETISCKRLFLFLIEQADFYIGDLETRLDLAKTWTFVLCENPFVKAPMDNFSGEKKQSSFYYKFSFGSYPLVMLNKVCDSDGFKSRAFFAKLDSKSFVEFMKILFYASQLGKGFHRHYVIYKTFQFVPELEIDELMIVCRTSLQHGFTLHSKHQLGLEIGKSIADNMAKNFDDLSTECLEIISNYLSSQFYSPAIAPKVIFLQDKVATEMKNKVKKFDVAALASLANVNLPTESPSPGLVAVLAETFLKSHPLDCSVQTLIKILLVCQKGGFKDKKDQVLDKVIQCYNSHLKDATQLRSLDKCFVALHLIYEKRYSSEILTDLFTDDNLTEKSKNGLQMRASLEYGESRSSHLIRTSLKLIQGLSELHFPSYEGPKFDQDKFIKYCECLQVKPPSFYITRYPDDMTNWTMVGSHIKKCVAREISERFGIPMKDALEKYVMETSILPFFNTVDYIVAMDSLFNFVPLPEDFMTLRLGSIKKPKIDEITPKYWFSVCYFDPSKNCIFSRAMHSARPIHLTETLDLGYRKVQPIDLSLYNRQFFHLKDQEVLKSVEEKIGLFFDTLGPEHLKNS